MNVYDASQARLKKIFDDFDNVYVSFSGGKDSGVLLNLAIDYIRKNLPGRRLGVFHIDYEAQYQMTTDYVDAELSKNKDVIDVYRVCLPIAAQCATSMYKSYWLPWDQEKKNLWVREMPANSINEFNNPLDFFKRGMWDYDLQEQFSKWIHKKNGAKRTACLVGIRTQESMNRWRAIHSDRNYRNYDGLKWTRQMYPDVFNAYPIYDWKVSDIWVYHRKNKDKPHNAIYDLMHQAGVTPAQQRLCQPYGDDQRRGLWLYHLLEPETWSKVVARVNGANGMALYVEESGNITGYRSTSKPEGHTYKSFCHLLLTTLPKKSRDHFLSRFKVFIRGWRRRGYVDDIPDEAPRVLENAHWAPSYRRLCKVLLRNDYWCKGLGLTQPMSEAYGKYMDMKKSKAQSVESLA